jgi:hypothetical protein
MRRIAWSACTTSNSSASTGDRGAGNGAVLHLGGGDRLGIRGGRDRVVASLPLRHGAQRVGTGAVQVGLVEPDGAEGDQQWDHHRRPGLLGEAERVGQRGGGRGELVTAVQVAADAVQQADHHVRSRTRDARVPGRHERSCHA